MHRCALVLVALSIATAESRAQDQSGTCISQNCRVVTPTDALVRLVYGAEIGSVDFAMAIAREVPTFPIPSSSAGAAWSVDLGSPRTSRIGSDAATSFAERPYTNGRRRLNVSLAVQHVPFAAVVGEPLSDLHRVAVSRSVFGNDTFDLRAPMTLAIDRSIFSASYGLADRIDVSLIVPLVRSTVHGTGWLDRTFDRTITLIRRDNVASSASGVGDIVLRSKIGLLASHALALAAVVDLRVPTGDAARLLGTGRHATTVLIAAGSTWGRVAPHVNVGYTFAGTGIDLITETPRPINRSYAFRPSDEEHYAVGADVAVSKRIAVAVDVIGRSLRGSAEYRASPSHFSIVRGSVNPRFGTVGAKVDMRGEWAITGTVLFPLNDAGVKPGLAPTIGLRRAF